MRVRRKTNLLLGAVALLIALMFGAQVLGVVPPAVYDMFLRAYPALFIIIGLAYLLRGRVPLSGLIALVVGVGFTVAVGAYAFTSRAGEQRSELSVPVSQPLSADLALLRLRVSTLDADVELVRAVNPNVGIVGQFTGSTESAVGVSYDEAADASGTFTLTETRPNALPLLEAVGRGALRLELPPNIPVDVELIAGAGAITLNLSDTRLERLNLDLVRGDALVTLPAYDPAFSEPDVSLGTLRVRDGDLTLLVPDAIAARLELDRGGSGIEPRYDPNRYNFLFNTVLEARAIESAAVIVQYRLEVPGGVLALETPN